MSTGITDGVASGPPDAESGGTGANLMSPELFPHPRAKAMRVELDKKSLFALASDTRLEILKKLQPMRRTVSQLSEALDIDKAAIHRHLKKMEEGGLVVRQEDHGFVYYGLSWKARDLMSPNENTKIVILISSALVFSIVASFFLASALLASDPINVLIPRGALEEQTSSYEASGWESGTWNVLILTICAAAAVIVSAIALRKVRRPRQRIDQKVESSTVERPVPED